MSSIHGYVVETVSSVGAFVSPSERSSNLFRPRQPWNLFAGYSSICIGIVHLGIVGGCVGCVICLFLWCSGENNVLGDGSVQASMLLYMVVHVCIL